MPSFPAPDRGTDPTPPTPDEIAAALAAVNAEQIAPGVWIVRLSNGVYLRLTAPTSTDAPAALVVPDAE